LEAGDSYGVWWRWALVSFLCIFYYGLLFSPFTSFAYGPFPYPLQMKQLRYDTFPNSMLMGAGRRLDQSCGCITDRFVMGDRYQQ